MGLGKTWAVLLVGAAATSGAVSAGPALAGTPLAGVTTRVSVASDGSQGDDRAYGAHLSSDGRWVAFSSRAANLAPDLNYAADVFLHDRATQRTTTVSVSPTGGSVWGGGTALTVSDDGRHVLFSSYSDALVPGDTNRVTDLFVRDTVAGVTRRVSVASDGTQGNWASDSGLMTRDGRYIAFHSLASTLVPGDTNGFPPQFRVAHDVFLHDVTTGATRRVSVSSGGGEAHGDSRNPSVDATGRFVVFDSDAADLVPGDTNERRDVFLHDTVSGVTRRISVGPGGAEADGDSRLARVSADGRRVAFISFATDLVAGDDNGHNDVFLHDVATAETLRLSDGPTGAFPYLNGISADGGRVAFVAAGESGWDQVLLWDAATRSTTTVSVTPSGAPAAAPSTLPALSADGRHVGFTSYASDLVPGDTNGTADVFVRTLIAAAPVPTTRSQCRDGGWRRLADGRSRPFRNQGDCVSWVATSRR